MDEDFILELDYDAEPYIPEKEIVEVIKKVENIDLDKKTQIKKNDVKKKNIDEKKFISKADKEKVYQDKREVLNIVFIGHVDAGKSTIGGHLLLLTGQVDKRTMEKYEKEAKEKNRETWYLSWALDTNAEERDKGKTVEVGKAYFETDTKKIVLLDAPGHKGFVPNMISGAAQADVAILVISARKGEFETGFERGGQTREHALIVKIAGTKTLIVLINKMDDMTVKWDKSRYDDIVRKLNPYLKKIGFKNEDIHYLPCSGFTGANLKDPLTPDFCPWYNGKSFIQILDALEPINLKLDDPPRLLVSDRYKDMGTVVICKVSAGYIGKNDNLILFPIRKSVKIANILSLDDDELEMAKVGENVKLRLANADEKDIPNGSILCSPDRPLSVGNAFDAYLLILDCKSIICPGFKAIFHLHNAVEEVLLSKILHFVNKSGEKVESKEKFMKQDSYALVRLVISNNVCATPFEEIPELGRFTLRDEGRTIAVGKIVKVGKRSYDNKVVP